ncbi:putative neuropeptide receptor [Nephila pilipes]|uniref:Putative neuropeptide receptor n=1 Tax=Nephila pilipes TaxID=299642 RepID=A0A8X6PHV3_NEPPI|nr:putative neuropeptide receptor [Nephila pilipes]
MLIELSRLSIYCAKERCINFLACLTATTLTLTAIACERFIAITFPLHSRITKHRNRLVITFIWVVSVIVSTPFLIVKRYTANQKRNFPEVSCEDDWDSLSKTYPLKQIYYTFMTMTLFFLPVIIMIALYLIVVRQLHELQVPGETNINVHQHNKMKVTKRVCIILVSFIVCWSPMQVATLYSNVWLSGTQEEELPSWFQHFEYTSIFLVHFNCALNPLMYAVLSRDFLRSLCNVFKCKVTRQLRRPNTF